ncbi:hypothetical protein BDZ97DRAFT_1666348, partial [Flammula alnicola]
PITTPMLHALHETLTLSDPFDACIWARATCSFFGLMHFGEVSITSCAAFNGSCHLKRSDAILTADVKGCPYTHLHLPASKTTAPDESQDIFLVEQRGLCPLEALKNLAAIVSALPNDPLFSWHDYQGQIHPMVCNAALSHINSILSAHGWGNAFGYSFHIGGASFYLTVGVDPEVICLHGHWKSLTYQALHQSV